MNYSSCSYSFGSLYNYDSSYEIVCIQFPEAIFSWKVPSLEQLKDLEERILAWRKKSKIILILNDHKSHYDTDNKFKSLFNLVYKYTDGVVHLGNYSLSNFKQNFNKQCKHVVIFHPLYISLARSDISNYEEKIDLDFNNKYVVSAIGNIRSIEEAKFVVKTFKKIKKRNKILVVPKMINLFKLPKYLPYRLRHIYKYIVEKYYLFPLKRNQYHFGFNHIDYTLMIDLIQKSSLMIIPRLKSLNSGLVYLGLTFNKQMIIPKGGNLTEFAKTFNYPLLDVKKNNYSEVFAIIEENKKSNMFSNEEFKVKKEKIHPKFIAKEYDIFFKTLIA